MYAYKVRTIREISKMRQTPLEHAESLEQLRALDCGARIHVTQVASHHRLSVDTPDDLARIERLFLAQNAG